MSSLNIEKLKRAMYIQERLFSNGTSQSDNTLETWIQDIELPKEYIENFLCFYKMTESELKKIFQQTVDEIKYSETPEWINYLKTIMLTFDNNEDFLKYIKNEEYLKHPFIVFAYPFLKWIYSNLTLAKEIDKDVVISAVLEVTLSTILKISSKTLIVELTRYSNENNLNGNNSEERYLDFCLQIQKSKNFEDIIYRYPTMIRIIIEECMQQQKYILEAVSNLINDFEDIKTKFNLSGEFTNIQSNLGDSHCGKKSVLIFNFQEKKIVYKPRSLDVDQSFNFLIDYINKKTLKFKIKKTDIIPKKNYGWQAYIEYLSCSNKEEVEENYYKIGVYSCLFHVLLGSDMHIENLVMCKSDPFFIDLESLFQGFNGSDLKHETSYEEVLAKIKYSVLGTCLFPSSINRNTVKDISGITGHGGQYIQKGKYTFEYNYTDQIKLVRKPYVIQHKKNIPLLNNQRVEPKEYTSFILDGFNDCYELILNNKQDFIEENGLIYKFNTNKVRTIVRNTNDYGIILNVSTHPQYLINAAYRNKLFDRMWSILNTNNKFKDIVPSEIKDLLNGDVPYFYSLVNSRSLYDSLDNEYENFHDESALNQVIKRIKAMNQEDKIFQISLIKLTLFKPIKKWELKEYKKDYSITSNLFKRSENYILEEAENIALEVLDLSTSTDKYNDICWLNVMIGNEEQWIISPLDVSLYDGMLGNALFFGYLYKITNKNEYLTTVEKILASTELYIKLYKNEDSISAYSGDASIAYCYYFLGIILNRLDLKQKGVLHILKCRDLIKNDNSFDIISGCAGTLIIALNIYKRSLNKEVLDVAIKCGDHLIENAISIDDCVGWNTPVGDGMVLAGMSHGNAGISWALIELYKITNNEMFLDYGNKAILYERKNYSPEDKNWFDLRNRENRLAKGFPEAVNWCHGAPGIGMARIKCFNILHDSQIRDEINIAIEKTLKEGFGGSDCLCHGSLGNMDILLLASTTLDFHKYYDLAKKITCDLIADAKKSQWYCGIPQKTKVPTFMLGLAGIGYGLLRVLDPVNVPSVLTLELPEEKYEET